MEQGNSSSSSTCIGASSACLFSVQAHGLARGNGQLNSETAVYSHPFHRMTSIFRGLSDRAAPSRQAAAAMGCSGKAHPSCACRCRARHPDAERREFELLERYGTKFANCNRFIRHVSLSHLLLLLLLLVLLLPFCFFFFGAVTRVPNESKAHGRVRNHVVTAGHLTGSARNV